MAAALNESQVLNRKFSKDDEIDEDDEVDIDIPMPSFATSSSPENNGTSKDKGKSKSTSDKTIKNETLTSNEQVLPEHIKIGVPLVEGDIEGGFKELKDTVNGKPQTLEAAGIKNNATLAFTPSLDEEFIIQKMTDDYYADEE